MRVDPAEVLRDDELLERWRALDRWLAEHRPLWHPRPFSELRLPWADEHDGLARWLTGLDDDAVDAIDAAAGPPLPEPMERWSVEARELTAVGAWPGDPDASARLQRSSLAKHGVRGRKWDQVARFAAATSPLRGDSILDWCGGKGHLGRSLGLLGARPVTVVDRDGALRRRALELAGRAGVRLEFVEADALDPATLTHLRPDRSVVVLHACGGLASALVGGLETRRVADLALAPCCYHLQHRERDGCRPLSRVGRAGALRLDHTALRLASSDDPLASEVERTRRRRENAWRLGLDLLLREAGADEYTPLGPLPRRVVDLPFEDFCRRVAADHGLRLPRTWSPEPARRAGETRAREARAFALVRSLFRRPLELWLVLDRALALFEHGYEVSVGTFCPPDVTPRNLLIRATAPIG